MYRMEKEPTWPTLNSVQRYGNRFEINIEENIDDQLESYDSRKSTNLHSKTLKDDSLQSPNQHKEDRNLLLQLDRRPFSQDNMGSIENSN